MNRLIIILAILSLTQTACKKFLQQPPYNNISVDDIFKDFEGARTTLVGCYSDLRSTSYYLRDGYVYADITGGNIKYAVRSNPQLLQAYNFTNDSVNNDMQEFYREAYAIIYSANNIISYINRVSDANQFQKNKLLADAHTIRALVHFDLVRVFAQPYNFTADAGHPGIVLKKFNSPTTNPPGPVATVKQVYDHIISDIDTALSLYPNSTNIYPAGNEKTWLSIDAARALQTRVNLYRENWTAVISSATALITGGKYPLITTNSYVNSWLGKNISSESIFEIAFGNTTGTGLGDYYNKNSNLYFQYAATNDLLSMFSAGDVRGASGMYVQHVINATPMFFTRKYQGLSDSANNIKIFRSSELYLSRAEANAQNNNLPAALTDLNAIRRRANPAATNFTSTDKQAILDEIFNERRRELCFEGHLFFDIARTKRNLVRNDCDATTCSFTYPNKLFATPKPIFQ